MQRDRQSPRSYVVKRRLSNPLLKPLVLRTIFRMKDDECFADGVTLPLNDALVKAALMGQKDIRFYPSRVRSDVSILLSSRNHRSGWLGLVPTQDLLNDYTHLRNHVGCDPSLVFATETGLIATYLLRFPVTTSQLQSLETRVGRFNLTLFETFLIPTSKNPMRIPSAFDQVDARTLEPACFTGHEALYSLHDILGMRPRRSNRALPFAGLIPEHQLAVDLIVQNYQTFEHKNDPRKRIRQFLTQLFLWKQYQDEIQKLPQALDDMDERYTHYKRLREQGLYPLPRILIERWNRSATTELMGWLVKIGLLEPVVSPLKGVNCTYYRISLPDDASRRNPNISSVQGIRDLLADGWSRNALCNKIGVSIRTLDHWLSGTRNMNAKHRRRVVNLLEESVDASTPPIQPARHLRTGPAIKVFQHRGATRHILPLLPSGTKVVALTAQSLPICGDALATDYLSASGVAHLLYAMAQASLAHAIVLTKEIDPSIIGQAGIDICDVRHPRTLATSLALLHQYDRSNAVTKALLGDAPLLGVREVARIFPHVSRLLPMKRRKTAYALLHDIVMTGMRGKHRHMVDLLRFYGRPRAFLMVRRFLIVCLRVWRGREQSLSPSYALYVLAQRAAVMMDDAQIRILYARLKESSRERNYSRANTRDVTP